MTEPIHNGMGVRRSAEIDQLAAALAAAQGEFKTVEKNREAVVKGKTREGNAYNYTFKYADLGDVLNVALPVLSKHGIAFTQPTVVESGVIYIRTTLMHKSGQWQESDYPVSSFGDKRHQQMGEALTFAKRYAGCAVLGIAPEETIEGNADMGGETEVGKPERRPSGRKPAEVVQSGDRRPLPPVAGEEPYIAADGSEVPPGKDLRTHYKEQAEKKITLLWPDGATRDFPSTKAGGLEAMSALEAASAVNTETWEINKELAKRLAEAMPELATRYTALEEGMAE